MSDIPSIPEDREPLDTKSMLEEAFLNNLKTAGMNKPAVSKEQQTLPSQLPTLEELPNSINREEMLKTLYAVHDELLESFGHASLNTVISKRLTTSINRIGSCIRQLGGTIETFNPLDHISGLQIPDIIRNTERVIETTKQCYSLGTITSASHNNNGEIMLVFSGEDNNVMYRASGTITSSSWSGNEAIDYIYTPGAGKMSVKAFENGKWMDKSSNSKYNIYWELEEQEKPAEPIIHEANKNEEVQKIEEDSNPVVNNDPDIKDSFAITEK